MRPQTQQFKFTTLVRGRSSPHSSLWWLHQWTKIHPQALYSPPVVRLIQIKSLPMEIPQALDNPPAVGLIQIKSLPMEIDRKSVV